MKDMKFSHKLALAVLPLAFVLAGCQTKPTTPEAEQLQQTPASLGVYQASNTEVKGFRPVSINDKQKIYVSTDPVFTRGAITGVQLVKDQQQRDYVALAINPKAQAALAAVPASRGYVTVVGGQVASLTGVRQKDKFLFMTRDAEVSNAIVRAVFPTAKKDTSDKK